MATLPQLAEALAPHDGRSVSTLRVVAQTLRDAGMMSVGRAGRGALHMGPDDCAALVLASLWTDSPSASPRAVEVLSGLKKRPGPTAANLTRGLSAITQLPTFGDVVGALIEFGGLIRRELDGAYLELSVGRPVPNASLTLIGHLGNRRVIAGWWVDADKLMAGAYQPEMRQAVDRGHSTTITSATLFALSDLIRREPARESA